VVRRFSTVCVVLLCACGGGSQSQAGRLAPQIDLSPTGAGWAAPPVQASLDRVLFEEGFYTGEIDVYELKTPAPGRLQVSLSWTHQANFDLFLSADPQGTMRLAEGTTNDMEPEYLGIDVASGQTVWILIAGRDGSPGDYTLETALLPFDAPVFDLVAAPDPAVVAPRNAPLVFSFNVDLDPDQDFSEHVLFVCLGAVAEGDWCLDGRDLIFFPRLPEAPGEEGGLLTRDEYTIQFPRGARGVRAVTGEYMTELQGGRFRFGDYVDPFPGQPPRVVEAVRPDDAPVVEVAIEGALEPSTVRAQLFLLEPGGAERPLLTFVTLVQRYECPGVLLAHLRVEPGEPTPYGAPIRLVIPGDVLRLAGTTGVTGPEPAPAGAGFRVDFPSP